MAAAGVISSDLVTSLSAVQSFPSFLTVCQRAHLSPLSVTSVSSSPPALPLPSALCSSSRTCSCLCRAKKWLKHIWGALEGTCCYLTEGPVILHCHAFTFANFRVCLVWQLEPVSAAGMVSKIFKAFRLVMFGKSHLIKWNMKGKCFL